MKVALFTETYVPDVNGVVTHVKTLRQGLQALGHEVLIVAADKHCKHHYIQDGILHCPSIEMKRFYGFGVAPPYSRRRLKMIRAFNPDVIHIHHEFGIGLSGIVYAKLYKKPLVYTLHTMYDQYMYYIAPKFFINTATKFSHQYERLIARMATMLTGPSQKCDEYFKRIGVTKEVNLIPNSADLETFDFNKSSAGQKDALRAKLGIAANAMIVCFAGRLGKEKSLDTLLDFWAEALTPADNLHMLIMGDGPEREPLAKQAQALGIADQVSFTGMIDHSEMPAYYAISDIFATASLSEMNSISMLESMASGLPVLQRYDELNADQIQTGVNGHLFNTAADMAEKLRDIRALSPEALLDLKAKVRASIVNRGATDSANYMLNVYERAKEEHKLESRKIKKGRGI